MVVRYLPDAPAFTRISVNNEYCRVFGVERKSLIDASATSLMTAKEAKAVARKIAAAIEARLPLLSIDTSIDAKGRPIKVRWLDIPVVDCSGAGQVVEMIAVGEVID